MRDLTGRRHDVTNVLIAVLGQLRSALACCQREPWRIAGRADELCTQRDAVLTVQQGRRRTTGRCQGIAPDGALRLETDQGTVQLYSGVVLDTQPPTGR
jgi:biotin-(acetyl-CoA carboxylase) ligase